MYGKPWSTRRLLIERSTTVYLEDGAVVTGSSHGLNVGDSLHFTGTADNPSVQVRDVWAMTIHQLGA